MIVIYSSRRQRRSAGHEAEMKNVWASYRLNMSAQLAQAYRFMGMGMQTPLKSSFFKRNN